MAVDKNNEDLTQMDAYEKAVQALAEDEQIAEHLDTLVGTEEFRTRVDANTCLRSLLIELLEEQQDLKFQEAIFDSVYGQFEDYFYRALAEYRLLSTLNNFDAGTERIELGSNFSIIKIAMEERAEILSQSRQPFGLSPFWLMPFNEYAFELYLKVPKVIGEGSLVPKERNIPSQIARRRFDEACSALRLFKSGAISYDYVRTKPTSWELHGAIPITTAIVSKPFVGTRYTLTEEEIPALLKFWDFFQRVRQKKRRRIDIALRRFNFAYERVRPEDKLIDYLIGFEALLLEGERQELEFRLALRGSLLLGEDANERKNIFEELKTAYRERSSIVHGGAIKEIVKVGQERVKFSEFVDRVEQRLRSAIKEFLRRSETQSESGVINDLDEKIIAGM